MPVFYQDPKMENGAVFTANVVRNDDVYVSDKTMAEILKAYDDGKFVIFDVNDSGYHFIFTEGTIALTNRTPYQGVFIFGNAMASFSADNATTVNNVDYFNMTLESSGDTLPEITDTDEGKVLTAKDGEAVWEEVQGTEVLVLDDINDLPEDTADGTIVVVPSEDSGESESGTSGGLTVVELTTEIAVTDATMHYFTLNAEDTAKMDEIANNLVPYILRVSVTQEGYTGSMPFVVLMSVMELMGTFSSSGSVAIGETEMKFQVIAVEGEYNLIIWNAAWGQFE